MEHKKKYVGLKMMRRPGARRPEGENLAALSRKFQKERDQIAREAYEKLKQRFAILGLEDWNREMHSLYIYR